MNRHYTADEYKALCDKLRSSFENASLTTDIMVGFNDETELDFNESLDFVKTIAFEKVHVFPYSERVGTAASKRGDNVPKQEKERRAAVMIEETTILKNLSVQMKRFYLKTKLSRIFFKVIPRAIYLSE